MLVAETGLSDSALHLLIGLAIFFAVYALSRSWWKALAVLTLIQAANEINDYTVKGDQGLEPFLIDTAFDTLWTLVLPLGFTVLASMMRSRTKK
jgi:hypothetical protein